MILIVVIASSSGMPMLLEHVLFRKSEHSPMLGDKGTLTPRHFGGQLLHQITVSVIDFPLLSFCLWIGLPV